MNQQRVKKAGSFLPLVMSKKKLKHDQTSTERKTSNGKTEFSSGAQSHRQQPGHQHKQPASSSHQHQPPDTTDTALSKKRKRKKKANSNKYKSVQDSEVTSTSDDRTIQPESSLTQVTTTSMETENVDLSSLWRHYRPRSNPLIRKGVHWFTQIVGDYLSREAENVDASTKANLKGVAAKILQQEVINHGRVASSGSKGHEAKFRQTVFSHGTSRDKLAAHVLCCMEAPVHSLSNLRALVAMLTPKSKGFEEILSSLTELFNSTFLPDRRVASRFECHSFSCLGPLLASGRDQAEKQLALWYFEDQLAAIYHQLIHQLAQVCKDDVEHNKMRGVKALVELLVTNPYQNTAQVLQVVVNKLGDPSRKVAAHTMYCLRTLLQRRAVLKSQVLAEVEVMLYRPNVNTKAQYYGLCFLKDMIFTQEDTRVATELVKLYFGFFKACTKKGEVDTRLMAALLRGLNRAFPYSGLDGAALEEQLDTLYKLCHIVNFSIASQALQLIFQVLGSRDQISDRFYQVLYRCLQDPAFGVSSGTTAFLNLLFKALVQDTSDPRTLAFIKRLLQVSQYLGPNVVCAVLYLVSEVVAERLSLARSLSALLRTSSTLAKDDEDDLEMYPDVEDEEDEEKDGEKKGGGEEEEVYHDMKDEDEKEEKVYRDVKDEDEKEEKVYCDVKDEDEKEERGGEEEEEGGEKNEIKEEEEASISTSITVSSPPTSSLQTSCTPSANSKAQSDTHSTTQTPDAATSTTTISTTTLDTLIDTPSPSSKPPISSSTSSSWHHLLNVGTGVPRRSQYDPYHRNPLYCGAEYSPLWELGYLKAHYHPSVGVFAGSVLVGRPVDYSGDPLQDFTLIRFLDRFVYRNPKKIGGIQKDIAGSNVLGCKSQYVPQGARGLAVNTEEFCALEPDQVPEDQVFFHRYFTQYKKVHKTPKEENGEDESDDDSVADEEFDEYLGRMHGAGDDDDDDDVDFAAGAKAKPKAVGGGDDIDDDDDDFEDDSGSVDDKMDLGDGDDDGDDDDDDDYDDDDDDEALWKDDDDVGFNEEETAFSDDEFDEPPKKKTKGKSSFMSGKTGGKKKGKGEDSLSSMFASAESFAHLLEENSDAAHYPGTGTSQALANRDRAHAKQLTWEVERDRKMKEENWRNKKTGGRRGAGGPKRSFGSMKRGKSSGMRRGTGGGMRRGPGGGMRGTGGAMRRGTGGGMRRGTGGAMRRGPGGGMRGTGGGMRRSPGGGSRKGSGSKRGNKKSKKGRK